MFLHSKRLVAVASFLACNHIKDHIYAQEGLPTSQCACNTQETNKTAGISSLTVPQSVGCNWNSNWDLRGDNQKDEEKKSKGVSHQIILIRHGQYEFGDSDEKRVLTDLGRQQANRTGERLLELHNSGKIHPIKYVYYSPLARATETHSTISLHLPKTILKHNVQPCSMIREGAVCVPCPIHPTWRPTDEMVAKDGARVEAAFINHMHRADKTEDADYSTVLVCHGNVIRYFVMRALQLPTNAWLRTSVANSSITIINVSPSGNVSLQCMGESGHLLAHQITFN
mmetsp:Transcript_15786/g.23739  ORF Transcript_15786/g.23739 Transcript_15786/m.23739 type:complete len:284 (+) Transcript_15786:57-908(+)